MHRTRFFLVVAAALACSAACAEPARVLILSGANNHDCKSTTPAIKATRHRLARHP